MLKKLGKAIISLLAVTGFVTCAAACATKPASSASEEATRIVPLSAAAGYADGVYRGFYNDSGIEQLSVQFELKNGCFATVQYDAINYKDGNYLSGDATKIQSEVASQYREAADYLIGKPASAILDLLEPTAVATDRDAVTSATLRTNKLASALQDGLNRGVFVPTATTALLLPAESPDGIYRGFYYDGAKEQVFVEFSVIGNTFDTVTLKGLTFDETDYLAASLSDQDAAVAESYLASAAYLCSKPLTALGTLYTPATVDVDAVSGATPYINKLISAMMDGLNRGVYEPLASSVLTIEKHYPNGTYRGFYQEGGIEQVSVQFEVVNDTFVSVRYRALNYTDGNYLCEEATPSQTAVYHQYLQLAAHLKGQPIASIYDLFTPGGIAEDIDGCSSATVNGNKLVSALMDGLGRGLYRQGDNE